MNPNRSTFNRVWGILSAAKDNLSTGPAPIYYTSTEAKVWNAGAKYMVETFFQTALQHAREEFKSEPHTQLAAYDHRDIDTLLATRNVLDRFVEILDGLDQAHRTMNLQAGAGRSELHTTVIETRERFAALTRQVGERLKDQEHPKVDPTKRVIVFEGHPHDAAALARIQGRLTDHEGNTVHLKLPGSNDTARITYGKDNP